jgi:sulfite reductase (NADPH) hemoprotein beta-component
MYRYDEFDKSFVAARVAQFRDQVTRRLSGELDEEKFRPLRLMNGVYLQLHAYMLRIAIPYGTLSSRQMRKLAFIAQRYDKGYGHFTTRQNIQFNWPALKDCPAILEELAEVEMHAIQTSGNCIRNVTADQFAGACADEIEDPRPYAEILRQWSSLHPEYSFLPRKFKIAVNGAAKDRAAIRVHDIGYQIVKNAKGEVGFSVYVGGGLGRTPLVAHKIRDFLPKEDLLAYTDAILRIYNLEGRRDNKYKARIKILVHEKGADVIRDEVEAEFVNHRDAGLTLPQAEIDRIGAYFAPPALAVRSAHSLAFERRKASDPAFARFAAQNVVVHKAPGYAIVNVSLKPIGGIPGDASADEMEAIADLAEEFSADEIRVAHEQNLVLPYVALDDLPELFDRLASHGLATANTGLVTDIISRPGDRPFDPRRAAHFGAVRRWRARAGNRRTQDQYLRLHQRLRASPCRPYWYSWFGEVRRRSLSDHTRRLCRRTLQRRYPHRPRFFFRRSRRRHRDCRRHLFEIPREPGGGFFSGLQEDRNGAFQGGPLWP